MNTRKGFTLVELLVVIAILAILATVSVVGYTSFINNANNSAAQQELIQVRDKVIADDILNKNVTVGKTIVMTVEASNSVKSTTDAEAAVVAYLTGLADTLDGTITVTAEVKANTVTEGEGDEAPETIVRYTVTVSEVIYTKDAGVAKWTLSTGDVE